jgi:putative FmdB family regulatory protein
MPVYEYYCKKCDSTFDVRHEAGKNGQKCPTCKSKAEKVFHAPGLIFKGSGFHTTDYCSKGAKEAPATSTESCSKAADKTCAGCEK